MMMQSLNNRSGIDAAMGDNLRRQVKQEINRRFLRNLPLFKVDSLLPAKFERLMQQLHNVEAASQCKSGDDAD